MYKNVEKVKGCEYTPDAFFVTFTTSIPLFCFVLTSASYFFPEYDALAKVIQQHPDRHETLK